MERFRNRRDAGQLLAERLMPWRSEHPVILGLPRGGVPVAAEVARALTAPLDVIVVRKLGVPTQPELGMGAVGEDGVGVLNDEVLAAVRVTAADVARVEARERAEVEARAVRFRAGRPRLDLTDRTVIVVDDGIATGGTARAALLVAREHGARRVVLAVPVAPPDTVRRLESDADEVVCLRSPSNFRAVGEWYDDFTPVSDDDVVEILASASPAPAFSQPVAPRDAEVDIPLGDRALPGHLHVPAGASGLVLFVHGSGSSRHSPRNQYVAAVLHQHGLATLLFDLLAPAEARDRRRVFDIEELADRLTAATRWVTAAVPRLPLGYFGASTGTAAALWAAAGSDGALDIAAIVSRGGRTDLAAPRLGAVRAPTLLIVGGADDVVLELNRDAAADLRCVHRLEIVAGATHLFEEPGTLETVAELAARWFRSHLPPAPVPG